MYISWASVVLLLVPYDGTACLFFVLCPTQHVHLSYSACFVPDDHTIEMSSKSGLEYLTAAYRTQVRPFFTVSVLAPGAYDLSSWPTYLPRCVSSSSTRT